ncbi:MAG: hypothetical protein KDD70_04825, partial [Bdellovibrionales bacterium]|nr:hypothetical protein [Bdellovibrionales bacterium]
MEAIEEVVVVDSLSEASELWKQYCRDELLYDSWGIRLRFSESEVTRPHFLKARFTDGTIGVLPLQWNESRSRYEFFGGVYMEGSSVLPHDKKKKKKRALYDRTP